MHRYLHSLGARISIAVLALLLGLVAPAHAGPPVSQPPPEVELPAAPAEQPAPVVLVYLIAYRSQGPSAVLLDVRTTSTRSAWWIQYAYCGGDPVNRSDPSGLDWEWVNGQWKEIPYSTPVPHPPIGVNPYVIGKNRFNAMDWAKYRDVDIGTYPGTLAALRAERDSWWNALPQDEKNDWILKSVAAYKTLRALDQFTHASTEVVVEGTIVFNPPLLVANGTAGVVNEKDLGGRHQSRLQGAVQIGAAFAGPVIAKGISGSLDSAATRVVGLGPATARSSYLEVGTVTSGVVTPPAWRGLPPARNLLEGTSELEVQLAGASVSTRVPLGPGMAPGRYMWVIDEQGVFYVGAAQKHSGLVPAGQSVRGAGWLEVLPSGEVRVMAQSGHYMDGYFSGLTPAEISQWQAAVRAAAEAQGVRVQSVTERDYWPDPTPAPPTPPAPTATNPGPVGP
jgi:hypothetical protein